MGAPPFRLRVLQDPLAPPRVQRTVTAVVTNLRRGLVFDVEPGTQASGATLRVGPRGATLYLPAGAPGGPFERSFDFSRQQPAARGRALADAVHRLYVGRPGLYYTRIAFVAGTAVQPRARHLFSVAFDGGDIRRLSAEEQPNLLPAWSPSGALIYTAFVNGGPLLVLRSPRGTVRQLAADRDLNTGAAFSPGGDLIAVSQSVDGNTDIYLLDRRGSVRRRLTTHDGIDISPSWSPDGRQLAFVSDREGSPQIYRLDLERGAIRRLTQSGFYNQEPAWCPRAGSRTIAYTHRYPGARYEVHLLDAESGKATPLTQLGGKSTSPSWAPDCSLLLYATETSGMWAVTPDGRHRRLLYPGRARSPAWSPVLEPRRF